MPKTETIILRIEKPVRDKLEKLSGAWSTTLSGAIRRLIIEAKVPKVDL